ncbi:MAG TPA: beta-propeller fold lactonase family protein [Terracidiphilus sp.]|nr:beta-propeller fold lactonase family protein [Terracidiphilus sp.]
MNSGTALVLAGAASLLMASLLTACAAITETLTVDFVYVASSKAAGANNYGQIDVFEINSESGKMRQIPASPFPSGGRLPIAETVSSDNQNLFVANQDDNNIVQFVIGTDGKLYPFNTVNTPGIFPLAVTANKSNLFVVDLYQPLPICSDADPCSGSIAVYPINPATSSNPVTLGTPVTNSAVGGAYWPLTAPNGTDIIVPTAVNIVASGSYVFVTAYDCGPTCLPPVPPAVGYVYGFSVGSGGALSPIPGSPFAAGGHPTGVASDSTSTYLYVTDSANADVLGFMIGSNGALTALSGSPFPAGNQPSAIVVDPVYPYVYVTNALDATVSAYSMSGGVLTNLGTYTVGTDPVAIGIDPSTEHFLFTANFLGNTVNGFELSTTAGTLLNSQFSPFSASTNPTAVAAIPHNGTGGGIAK